MRVLTFLALASMTAGPALATTTHFSEATETNDQLIELYDEADGQCSKSRSHDVRVTVACVARSIYGVALNERGICYGKRDQPNASMSWHACASDSMYFPSIDLPKL